MGIPPLQFQQQPGVLDQYGKALQIKQMMGAGQLQQQQVQENDITLQQKRQQMQEQELIKQTLGANNGDLEASLPQLAGKVNPKTLSDLTTWAMNKKKESLEIGEKERAAKIAQGDQLLGLIAQAKALPPEQYASSWGQIAASAMKIRPDLQINPQQPVPQEALDSLALGIVTDTQFYKKAQEDRQAREASAKLPGELADSKMKVEEANVPLEKRKLLGNFDMATYQDWLKKPENAGKNLADFQIWKAKHSPTMMMNGSLSLTPEAIKMAGDLYKKTGILPAGFSRAPQVTSSVINNAAKTEDGSTPDIAENKIQFANKKALDVEYFGRGKTFQNIRTLNTGTAHVGRLYDAVDALDNGNLSKLNQIANSFNLNVRGMSAPAVFDAIKAAAAGEMASMFKGAAATDPEIASIAATINSSLAGQVNKDVLKEDLHLLGSRLYSIDEQYRQNNNGTPAPNGKILFRNSQNILKRVGVQLDEYQNPETNPQRPPENAGGGEKEIHYTIKNGQLVPE
jgi:hypothetical protein